MLAGVQWGLWKEIFCDINIDWQVDDTDILAAQSYPLYILYKFFLS